MPTITISPNMGMPVPNVSEDPGPDWATNVNSSLSIVDSHNHSLGQGVPITPDGINLNTALPFNDFDATDLRSVRFYPQIAPISETTDLGCLYESGVDLYYNDGIGNQIRITQSGSVSGAAGTITGLPSGTASASYAAGTFTFQSATSTPATMNVGPIVTGAATANPKTVTISASASQPANYALTYPTALPVSTSYLTIDSSGNMATNTSTGSGAVVLATSPTITSATIVTPTITSPTFSGLPSGTIVGAAFSPSSAWVYSSGGTLTINITSAIHYYTRIGNIVTATGIVNSSYGVPSGGTANYNLIVDIPISTTTLLPVGVTASGNASVIAGSVSVSSGPSTVSVLYRYTYIIN